MGGIFSSDRPPGGRHWGAVARGVAEIGPSTDPKKRVLVKTEEYLPAKPTFTFSVLKAQSQGCKARFGYQVEVCGNQEFWLTVTRKDAQPQGWEHDVHVRWEASGKPPVIAQDDTRDFEAEVANMVAMGYSEEAARRALHMKDGDLGAAASFIGACEIADSLPGDPASLASAHFIYLPKVIDGVKVLEKQIDGKWKATQEHYPVEPGTRGLGHRRSKFIDDKTNDLVLWGCCVAGEDEQNGWIKCDLEEAMKASRQGDVQMLNLKGGDPSEEELSDSTDQVPLPGKKGLSSMESVMEPESLAGWSA